MMASINSKSLLRKFSIIFIGISLIPLIILFYLYSLFDESHQFIRIVNSHFALIIYIAGAICIIGFFGIRLRIKKIMLLNRIVKKTAITQTDRQILLELAEEKGEIGELAKSFINSLNPVTKKEQEQKETTEIIYDLLKKTSEVFTRVNNYDELIRLVLETTVDALGAKQGALFSADDNRYALKASVGMDAFTPEEIIELTQTYLDEVAEQNRFLLITADETSEQSDRLFTPPLIFLPLVHEKKYLGVLCFGGNSYWNTNSNPHMATMLNLSYQISASLGNAKTNKNSDQVTFEMLAALALAVEARDPYSRGHSARVCENAKNIGELIRLPEKDKNILYDASTIHDIGKIGIRYGILNKRGNISVEGKAVIRYHPIIGESILLQFPALRHLLDPVRHHHERLDGSGYPDSLNSEKISTITNIMIVADLFDTLTEGRSYRTGMHFTEAKRELDYLVNTGRLDKDIVRTLYHTLK